MVIDHSGQVEAFGSTGAFNVNEALNYERYAFIKWVAQGHSNFAVTLP